MLLSIYLKVVIPRVLFIGRITCVARGSCPLYESHARNHDLSLGPEKDMVLARKSDALWPLHLTDGGQPSTTIPKNITPFWPKKYRKIIKTDDVPHLLIAIVNCLKYLTTATVLLKKSRLTDVTSVWRISRSSFFSFLISVLCFLSKWKWTRSECLLSFYNNRMRETWTLLGSLFSKDSLGRCRHRLKIPRHPRWPPGKISNRSRKSNSLLPHLLLEQ